MALRSDMPGVYQAGASTPFNDVDSFIRVSDGIVGVAESHPGCLIFELGDGDRLCLWFGGNDYADRWEVVCA